MEVLVESIQNIESILIAILVFTIISSVSVAYYFLSKWFFDCLQSDEKVYQENKQDATHRKIDLLHDAINKQSYHLEMELLDIHKDLEKLNKKVLKK